MAITALATQNTTIGPAQFADMQNAVTIPFKVDGPEDFRMSIADSNTIRVAAGAGVVGGSRVRSTAEELISIPSVSSGYKWVSICLEVDWSTSVAKIIPLLGDTNSNNIAYRQRDIGTKYQALIGYVKREPGTLTALNDMRMWGGNGGPYVVTSSAIDNPLLDAPAGTWIATDQSTYTKRKDDDGVWRSVGVAANPWKTYTPTLRFHSDTPPNGTSGGTVAGQGNGGTLSARYRVVDGVCEAFIQITAGSTGATWGDGPLTVDLPLPAASWQEDIWSEGHFYNYGYGSVGAWDWPAQALIKKGWRQAMIFSVVNGEKPTMGPLRAATRTGGAGSGLPAIVNAFTVGTITLHLSYPVAV